MKFKNFVFDLDGTLTDSAPGIMNSVKYALDRLGIDEPDRDSLYRFVGPPLIYSYETYYGIKGELNHIAVKYFQEYFKERGMFENEVYKGIPELLTKIKDMGGKNIIATSKPEEFSVTIIKHFGLEKYFDYIAGSRSDETRTGKDEIIAYALETSKISDLASTVMIGDRSYDMLGAKKNSLYAVGALYGYGSRDELVNSGADEIAESVESLKKILLA